MAFPDSLPGPGRLPGDGGAPTLGVKSDPSRGYLLFAAPSAVPGSSRGDSSDRPIWTRDPGEVFVLDTAVYHRYLLHQDDIGYMMAKLMALPPGAYRLKGFQDRAMIRRLAEPMDVQVEAGKVLDLGEWVYIGSEKVAMFSKDQADWKAQYRLSPIPEEQRKRLLEKAGLAVPVQRREYPPGPARARGGKRTPKTAFGRVHQLALGVPEIASLEAGLFWGRTFWSDAYDKRGILAAVGLGPMDGTARLGYCGLPGRGGHGFGVGSFLGAVAVSNAHFGSREWNAGAEWSGTVNVDDMGVGMRLAVLGANGFGVRWALFFQDIDVKAF